MDGALTVKMDQRVRDNGIPAVVGAQIILGESPTQTNATKVPVWRRIALNTGFNCGTTCTADKVGAIRIEQDVGKAFVNFIALSSRTTKKAPIRRATSSCTAEVKGGRAEGPAPPAGVVVAESSRRRRRTRRVPRRPRPSPTTRPERCAAPSPSTAASTRAARRRSSASSGGAPTATSATSRPGATRAPATAGSASRPTSKGSSPTATTRSS